MASCDSNGKKNIHVVLTAHWDWVLYHYRLSFARALRNNGYQVTFVCPAGHYFPKLEAEGFSCVRWKISRKSLNPLREAVSIVQLVRIYRRLAPDIIHHFTVKPNLYGTIAAHYAKTPIVINTFTGLGYLFSDDFLAGTLRFFLHPFLKWMANYPRAILTFQTDSARKAFITLGILNSDRRSVVIRGSGVDLNHFKKNHDPIPKPQSSGKPVVLMASRLLRHKGIKEFVEMAKMLKSQKVEALFWIAGAPDDGNPACLSEREIKQCTNGGPVQFLGHHDDILDILNQADIAVLPSYHEGVPRFLMEAAAVGLPLVASDIDGCKSVIRQGVNGFLISPRDTEAFASAVKKLVQDPELRVRMGDAGHQIVADEFDERLIHRKFLDMYDELSASRLKSSDG